MDRWTFMVFRAYGPCIGLGVLSAVFTLLGPEPSDGPFANPFATMFAWASFGAALASLGAGIFAAYSLWRWQRGLALACHCGGLLGRERPGIRGRTDYRQCLACGKNVSSNHYS
jgi:hypothetical protein